MRQSADETGQSDAGVLSRLGYAQELRRVMGGFSSFALSFSIISVVTGIVSTYGDALKAGGPAALGLGWPLVAVGTLFVALAMGELASAFPTAGALYHWAALLGGPGWGWLTAAMNLAGQVAIVAAIDLTCAQTLTGTLGLASWTSYPVFVAILAVHAVLNVGSVRLVAWLNDLSAPVHVVGVLLLVVLLLVFGRARPLASLAETGFTSRTDGYALGFVQALVLGMWTFTGYDASAHVSEETKDPARRTPWGIVWAVIVSAVAGYALVVALTLAVRDVPAAAREKDVALFVLRGALGETAGRAAMGLAIATMWFCGLSSVTSASRMLFAFARDGGLPFSSQLRRVSPRWQTPHIATLVAVVAPALLVLATAPLSDEVFLAVASLATSALYVSYAVPIAPGASARARGAWKKLGPWNLGRAGVPIACVAVLWSALVLFVGYLANRLGFALLLGVLVAVAILYVTRVRGRFRGPKIDLATFQGDKSTAGTRQ